MTIENIDQAQQILKKYIPDVAGYSGDGMSLDRMWPLLKRVGNPQDKLKIIHVAGTSGKTSTCYFISEILTNSGQKTGLTVSPHVDSITERVQINGKPISDKEFCLLMAEFLVYVEEMHDTPSYFELMVVFVYWVFASRGVQYAVIETGMGGALDGSNVATRADKVCVITDIGLDHTHILGDTVQKIANQKAGIIHAGNTVFMNTQDSNIVEIFRSRVDLVGAELHTQTPLHINNKKSEAESIPLFQYRNWQLANSVCRYVSSRDGFTLSGLDQALAIEIPGRMQVVSVAGQQIIMDGAHNAQKTQVFTESYKAMFPGKQATILIALKKGKEYKEVIDNLSDIATGFIVTTFNTSQDLPAVSQDPDVISNYAISIGLESTVCTDHHDALEELLSSSGQKLAIGSFYLLGQLRAELHRF